MRHGNDRSWRSQASTAVDLRDRDIHPNTKPLSSPPHSLGPDAAHLKADSPTIARVVPFDRREGAERRRSTLVQPPFQIAVLLPCRNEALTIGAVVRNFKTHLPSAEIHVYDNASTDETSKVALEAGAIVHYEGRPGKGGVVRRMFSEVEADIYVMADGDGTYDAAAAPRLVRTLVENGLDMVVGRRREAPSTDNAYPPGHRMGNALLTGVVQYIFGQGCMDMLSGYRVLSRRYVKSFPVNSRGFEIETEMTVHALDLRLPVGEVNTLYNERDPGSQSKLRTVPDGVKILAFVGMLVKDYKPATFFGMIGLVLATLAVLLREVFFGTLVAATSHNGAVVTVGALGVAAVLSFLSGMILDSVSRSRREIKRMVYLNAGRTAAPQNSPRARSKDIPSVALNNFTESR